MADSSLEDIIKQKRSSSRASRGGGRGARRGARGTRGGKGGKFRSFSSSTYSNRYSSPLSRKGVGSGFKASRRGGGGTRSSLGGGRGMPQRSNSIQLGGPMGTSIIVSNLDFGVNDADINELFSEFGRLRRYGVHYNAQGSSIGTAEVVFTRSSDAMKAIQAYQDVPLDGRPMRLHVAMSSFRITQLPGESPAPSSSRGGGGGGGRGGGGGQRRGGRSRRGGRGARGRGEMGRKVPSANELNADLDKYHKVKSDSSRTEGMDQS